MKNLLFLTALLGLLTSACYDKVEIFILEPERASMLPAGEDVQVKVKAKKKTVLIQGVKGPKTVLLPELDGLGFITAVIEGDPMIAVRSYHQGNYRPAHDWHEGTIALAMGQGPLSSDPVSLASLTSEMLTEEQLASYVDNPIRTSSMGVPVTINADSVISPQVVVSLENNAGGLVFSAELSDVLVDYTASATVLSSSGTALYETISVSGDMTVSADAIQLDNLDVQASDPIITDSGGLPSAIVDQMAGLLAEKIPPAIATATENSAEAVFTNLILGLSPSVGIAFEKPLAQETQMASIAVEPNGLAIDFETMIEAASPAEALDDHQVLFRQLGTGCQPAGTALQVVVGSPLVNQFAFAIWDAGNLKNMHFTKSELRNMGMADLDFPYDKLDHVDITLLLPPLLEWTEQGPLLDLGGIQTHISIDSSKDSTAWTAASVPVKLVQDGQQLRIQPDPDRPATIREVGFNRLNEMADQDKVLQLMGTAVPGVVARVFGDIPAISLPDMNLERLDGSAGPTVRPELSTLHSEHGCWRLDLELTKVQ